MIFVFDDDYFYLSNFYFCDVEYEGVMYPSSEHAFQAAKTKDQEDRLRIKGLRSPDEAKWFGQKVTLREDWEHIKHNIMLEILRDKFTRHEYLKKALLSTGDKILIEGNSWHDNYWGKCICPKCMKNGKAGRNMLGILLMNVRQELSEGIE